MKLIAFLIAMVLFVGGMISMGYAFEPDAAHFELFFGGVLAISLSLAIPFHILKRIDG